MRQALIIIKNSAKSIWIDRGMFISDLLLATSIPFLIQVLIWKNIYTYQNSETKNIILGFKFNELMFYYVYAILLGRLNNCYDLIVNYSQTIQEGGVETYLIKPLQLTTFELFKFIGGGLIYLIPIVLSFIVSIFFLKYQNMTYSIIIEKLFYIIGVFVLIGLSQILCFYIGWSISQLCFWFVRSDFLANLTLLVSSFFGGELLPFSFWPSDIRPLLIYNPFSFLIARPSELLIHHDTTNLIHSFYFCLLYILFFKILSDFLFNIGRQRYESVGG